MKSIIEILNAYGGMNFLQVKKILNAKIKPSGRLEISFIKNSPNNLPAISVSFLDENFAPAIKIEMRLEITDLGWSPFYFKNEYLNYEGNIYRLNKSGKVIGVDYDLKRTFIEVAESWDEQIRDYGIENILQNRRRSV